MNEYNFNIDNWDVDHRNTANNEGVSSPVIIHAECRIKYSSNDKLEPYDCISGIKCNSEFKVTIHNYKSEALGFDPTIKSEQNYLTFLHLSTLLNFPWGMNVRFRDSDGVIFGAGDIIKLLEERTDDIMEKWEEGQVEFKKRQDETVDKLNRDDNDDGVMKI